MTARQQALYGQTSRFPTSHQASPIEKEALVNPIWQTDTLLHQPTGHSQPS